VDRWSDDLLDAAADGGGLPAGPPRAAGVVSTAVPEMQGAAAPRDAAVPRLFQQLLGQQPAASTLANAEALSRRETGTGLPTGRSRVKVQFFWGRESKQLEGTNPFYQEKRKDLRALAGASGSSVTVRPPNHTPQLVRALVGSDPGIAAVLLGILSAPEYLTAV
jgi:hypothetical protein